MTWSVDLLSHSPRLPTLRRNEQRVARLAIMAACLRLRAVAVELDDVAPRSWESREGQTLLRIEKPVRLEIAGHGVVFECVQHDFAGDYVNVVLPQWDMAGAGAEEQPGPLAHLHPTRR